jgi:amino acid transporter
MSELLEMFFFPSIPDQVRAFILAAFVLFAWGFIGWYYPIENIRDKTKPKKMLYYILLFVCGILPIIMLLVGYVMNNAPPPAALNANPGV